MSHTTNGGPSSTFSHACILAGGDVSRATTGSNEAFHRLLCARAKSLGLPEAVIQRGIREARLLGLAQEPPKEVEELLTASRLPTGLIQENIEAALSEPELSLEEDNFFASLDDEIPSRSTHPFLAEGATFLQEKVMKNPVGPHIQAFQVGENKGLFVTTAVIREKNGERVWNINGKPRNVSSAPTFKDAGEDLIYHDSGHRLSLSEDFFDLNVEIRERGKSKYLVAVPEATDKSFVVSGGVFVWPLTHAPGRELRFWLNESANSRERKFNDIIKWVIAQTDDSRGYKVIG